MYLLFRHQILCDLSNVPIYIPTDEQADPEASGISCIFPINIHTLADRVCAGEYRFRKISSTPEVKKPKERLGTGEYTMSMILLTLYNSLRGKCMPMENKHLKPIIFLFVKMLCKEEMDMYKVKYHM